MGPADILNTSILMYAIIGFGGIVLYLTQTKNMIPKKEMRKGGKPLAIFFTKAGEIKLMAINDIKGRSFSCKYGVFQLTENNRYSFGQRDIYFYNIGNANPLNIEGMLKVQNYLTKSLKPELSKDELANIALDDKASKELGPTGLRFLAHYYDVDVLAKADSIYEASTNKVFKLADSRQLKGFIPQKALFWRNVAIVIINDRYLDVVPVQVVNDIIDDQPVQYIINDTYGEFEVKDARTRYRKAKTNVYLVAVKTIKEPGKEIYYKPVHDSTISLNTSILPRLDLVDPLWGSDSIKVYRENKIREDLVSSKVRKGVNPRMVVAVGMISLLFLVIGVPVLSQQGLLDLSKIKIPGLTPTTQQQSATITKSELITPTTSNGNITLTNQTLTNQTILNNINNNNQSQLNNKQTNLSQTIIVRH